MAKRIRTECSVEINDVLVVNRWGRSVEGWCSGCGTETTLVTPEDAATLSGIGARSVYRLIELEEIHSQDAAGDLLLVCLVSLLERAAWDFSLSMKERR